MIKKIYNINGFDCANCANKAEKHMNKDNRIQNARIDFAGNRLYISFADKEMNIEDIKELIREVETDEIEITDSDKKVKKTSVFTKELILTLIRVMLGVIVIVLSFTVFNNENSEYHFWINFSLYALSILVLTYDIVFKVWNHIIHKENPIDEYFLILVAAIGAFVIASVSKESHDFMESLMVIILFQLGSIIESVATNKSKEAIVSAVDQRNEMASIVVDGEVKKVNPSEIKIGDTIVVVSGEMIPVDGIALNGECLVDTSSLTGEYVPINVKQGDMVSSGFMIKSGTLKMTAKKEFKDSTVSKIIELISNSGERKSEADKFITKFARWYTPLILVLSLAFMLIGGLVTNEWPRFVLAGLKMLVVACPCAVIISVPLAYFSAIGLASKNGIVIKGTVFLDQIAKIRKLVTDKTGTLTHGSFKVNQVITNGVNEDELMNYFYIAECMSNHPIGKAICHDKDVKRLINEVKDFREEIGLGTMCEYKGDFYISGSVKMMRNHEIVVPDVNESGSVVYLAKNNNYLGYVVLTDEIKEDAEPMVSLLHKEGIEIILLTGDKKENAEAICKKLNIDRWHSELLPEEKTKYLQEEMNTNLKFKTAYIGDGINDAASIRMSDVGIAMGGIGSDVAVENADIVIMNDDPAKVYDAYKIGKIARHTSVFNIVFALLIKLTVELLAIIPEMLNLAWKLPMWVAVLSDTGLTVLMVINSLLVLYRRLKKHTLEKHKHNHSCGCLD